MNLSEDRIRDRIGGKAHQLLQLKNAGFKVPEFLVLETIELVQLVPVSWQNKWDYNEDDIPALYVQLTNEFHTTYATELCESLEKRIIENFGQNYCISLRSSSAVEDGMQHSFAGLYESVLNVNTDNFEEALKTVLLSAISERILKYHWINKISFVPGKLAIICQEMLQASYSGVLFTMDVHANLNNATAVLAEGLGDKVVGGILDTDIAWYDRQRKLLFCPESPLYTEISDANWLHLFETALRVEEVFGFACDIEYSFNYNMELYLLQCRPITGFKKEKIKIYDNSNIVESYPGITLPLTFHFALKGYRGVFSACKSYFLMSDRTMETLKEPLENMLAHVQGRVYYQLHHWHQIISKIIASKEQFLAWERLVGIQQSDAKNIRISWLAKLKNVIVVLRLIVLYPFIVKRFYKQFSTNYSAMKTAIDKARTAKECMSLFENSAPGFYKLWAATLVNDFFTFRLFDLLVKLCKSRNIGLLANDLLCGMEDVESETVILELRKLCEKISEKVELHQFILSHAEEDGLAVLLADKEMAVLVENYLIKFGCRVTEELKLEVASMNQDKLKLLSEIKKLLQVEFSSSKFLEKQKEIKATAEVQFFEGVNWVQKQKRRLILNLTRYAVKNRENMRLNRSRAYESIKILFTELGINLVKEGKLKNSRDIFYFSLDELKLIMNNKLPGEFDFVERRKLEFKQFKDAQLPDRFIFQTEQVPIPISSKTVIENADILMGIGVSGAKLKGEVLVLENPSYDGEVRGKILVTKTTDPGWIFLMSRAAGIISEKGSLLSHTAIVGRELGIPVVTGAKNILQYLKTGDWIEMDGTSGEIKRILEN